MEVAVFFKSSVINSVILIKSCEFHMLQCMCGLQICYLIQDLVTGIVITFQVVLGTQNYQRIVDSLRAAHYWIQ
jgi:hypothetical protein